MKNYPEFNNAKIIEDKDNPFCTLYEYEDGSRFYIEPIFYAYLQNLKIQHGDRYQDVLNEMEKTVKRNRKVIFTGMDEESDDEPVTKTDENYVLRTLFDITNYLCIYVEDKSRGSDYGD